MSIDRVEDGNLRMPVWWVYMFFAQSLPAGSWGDACPYGAGSTPAEGWFGTKILCVRVRHDLRCHDEILPVAGKR